MGGRQQPGTEIGRMGSYFHVIGFGQGGHFPPFAHAADFDHTRLNKSYRSGVEHFFELVGGAGIFTGSQRRPAQSAQFGQGPKILGRPDGFLQPVKPIRSQLAGHLQGFFRTPGAVDVHHQQSVFTYQLADCLQTLHIPLVELDLVITRLFGVPGRNLQMDRVGIADQAGISGDFG